MKFILPIIALLIALATPATGQITFTSDSTFNSHDTSWVQLDTINVGGKTWYQLSQVNFDRAGNRVITSFAPRTKKQMREYVREGLEQSNAAISRKVSDLASERAQKNVLIAIRDALNE